MLFIKMYGIKLGSAVNDDTSLELLKFHYSSDFLICHAGGPIFWNSIRKNNTALSSCGAKIMATNEISKVVRTMFQ